MLDILNLYPMDFEEFLLAKDRNDLIDLIIESILENKMMPPQIHEMILNIYREYLICGGMPESVQNYINHNQVISMLDNSILDNINNANVSCSDIFNDSLSIYKGVIAENYVAQQLISNNIGLNYWRSNNTAEIDFIYENNDGVIPIEVKALDNKKSKSLTTYINKYSPSYSIRVSAKNFGYDKDKRIISLPLYAACFINRIQNK